MIKTYYLINKHVNKEIHFGKDEFLNKEKSCKIAQENSENQSGLHTVIRCTVWNENTRTTDLIAMFRNNQIICSY